MCAGHASSPSGHNLFLPPEPENSQTSSALPRPSYALPLHSSPLRLEVWPSEDRHCGWRWASSEQLRPKRYHPALFLCSSPPLLSLRACHGILTGRYPLSAVCLAPMMGSSLPPRGAAGGPVRNCPERTARKAESGFWAQPSTFRVWGCSQTTRHRALAPSSMVRLEAHLIVKSVF